MPISSGFPLRAPPEIGILEQGVVVLLGIPDLLLLAAAEIRLLQG